MTEQLHVLKTYFGYDNFRDGQEEIIAAIMQGQDVVAIMPTGAGKSLCYQVPAMLLDGVTLVISPLISLMKDQVNALVQSGVPAAYLNSSLTTHEQTAVLEKARNKEYKLLYVAPEQLLTERFSQFSNDVEIPLISVDEAHCVSQWGHDFRPGYLKVVEYIEQLTKRPIISAFTATATEQVKTDIRYILNLQDPFTLTTGFDRPNLKFTVLKPQNKSFVVEKYLLENIEKSGIIYCSTRKEVEALHDKLSENGHNVTKYHAGLSSEERTYNQEAFVLDEKPIIIATNAFGMGIDKSNVSYVIHYNMPKNIENYYQEAGRAGRDGSDAECILLYGGKDVRTNQFFIDNIEVNEELDADTLVAFKEVEHDRLKQMTFYCYTQACLRYYILNYFGEKGALYCGNCSNCLNKFEKKDVTVEAQKILSCVKRLNENFGIVMVVDVLRGSKKARVLNLGLNNLSTYAILAEYSETQVRHIIQVLLAEDYLAITASEYPVLKLGVKAKYLLFEGETLSITMPKAEERVEAKPTKKKATESHNPELFAKLQKLRQQLAAEQNVPAYVIFSNATLNAMCEHLPQTLPEMLQISGVGEMKLEKYGQQFLELIINH